MLRGVERCYAACKGYEILEEFLFADSRLLKKRGDDCSTPIDIVILRELIYVFGLKADVKRRANFYYFLSLLCDILLKL